DHDRLRARRAQRHMQYGATLGGVDLLAAEHRFDLLWQIAGVGKITQAMHRVGGDALLRVVQIQSDRFGGQRLAAGRIGREELAQMGCSDLRKMLLERLPLRARGEAHLAHRWSGSFESLSSFCALSAMRCSSWFHDLTNAAAPSTCS